MGERVEERIELAENDYRRFLAAVVGHEVPEVDSYPLASSFLPFAMPSWRLVGAHDLPSDGASPEAIPCISDRKGGVMGLGQEIQVTQRPSRQEALHRVSDCIADEQKDGRSGPFRLVTVERETRAGVGLIAVQHETFAIRSL